jgi:hypothetical protein
MTRSHIWLFAAASGIALAAAQPTLILDER